MPPRKTFWNETREDNFETATTQGIADANDSAYTFVRDEAKIYSEAEKTPDMIPLKLYWSEQRGDNFTTATPDGIQSALSGGYVEVRIEGYVYPNPQADHLPLITFWNTQREDNMLAGSNDSVQSARDSQYQQIRIEGYALPPSAPSILGVSPNRGKVGDTVTVTGVNLDQTEQVFFGIPSYALPLIPPHIGDAAAFSIVSPTTITAVVPGPAASGWIGLVTPRGTAISPTEFLKYIVVPPPQPNIYNLSLDFNANRIFWQGHSIGSVTGGDSPITLVTNKTGYTIDLSYMVNTVVKVTRLLKDNENTTVFNSLNSTADWAGVVTADEFGNPSNGPNGAVWPIQIEWT